MKTAPRLASIILFTGMLSTQIGQAAENQLPKTGKHTKSMSVGIGLSPNSKPGTSRIGLGLGILPEYEGADKLGAVAMPLFDISAAGAYFIKGGSINLNDGLASAGVGLLHLHYRPGKGQPIHFSIGPMLRAWRGREQKDSTALAGLGDIDQGVGIGAFAGLYVGPLQLSLKMNTEEVADDRDANTVVFDMQYSTTVSRDLQLTSGLSASWADDEYMQAYFGISTAQALNSIYAPYAAGAGIKDIGIQIQANYDFSPHWALQAEIGYWRLLNDAANSPLVKQEGTEDQLRALIGISYRF